MAGGDWIKIHRAVMDHPVFEDPLLWKVFSWCILKANYRAGSFRGAEVPVGSFVTGKLKAAEELSIPPTTWYRSIKRLSEPPFSCITVKADHNWTTITVCNYTTYQNLASVGGPQVDHKRTTSGPQVEPIEEEQELLSLSQGRGKIKVPESWDREEFWSLVGKYRDHWFRGKGRKLDDITLGLQLKNVGHFPCDKVCRSMEKAIRSDKYALYDPDEVHPAFAPKGAPAPKLKRLN